MFEVYFKSRVQSENAHEEKRIHLDGVCFKYERLFNPVQCTACRICQCSSRDKLFWLEVIGILWTSEQLQHLWSINCFGNGTRQYSTCLYQSGSSHTFFSYQYILSILGKNILLWISLINVWQLLHLNYNQCQFFGRSFWSCKYNMIESQFWFYLEKEVSIFSNFPTHLDSDRKNIDNK